MPRKKQDKVEFFAHLEFYPEGKFSILVGDYNWTRRRLSLLVELGERVIK